MLQDTTLVKLNLGCGANKIKGCVNVDIEKTVNPDVVADFRYLLPYADNSVDTVYMFHVIEHIEEAFHHTTLAEIWRVLKHGGTLFLSYPEFTKIAQNYIDNYLGKRDFWKRTIYGRQLYKADYHVALMDSRAFRVKLLQAGFIDIEIKPEKNEDYNTVVKCSKGNKVQSYEDLVTDSVFNSPSLR